MRRFLRLIVGSLTGKLIVLTAFFLIVPLMLYSKFETADAERQAFLLNTLQIQGKLAASALEPELLRLDPKSLLDAATAVQNLAAGTIRLRLLLRPTGRDSAFFLVAVNPPVDPAEVSAERDQLEKLGILSHLDESCAGDQPLNLHYVGASGQEELLTSLTPIHTNAGCWVLLTGYAADDLAASSLARPFSQAPEVRWAMGFYGLMAVLILMASVGTLLDLRRFANMARHIRHGDRSADASFARVAAVPELAPVAREFDAMVSTLDTTARAMREAAEDNAHSLKAPIAAIMQSIEPLRFAVLGVERPTQALAMIEKAVERLGSLVDATRRIDVAAADLMKAMLQPVDLASLAAKMAAAYDRLHVLDGVKVIAFSTGPAIVNATEDSLETVLENLLDNAVGFSPPGSTVRVTVNTKAGRTLLTIDDEGPGVAPDLLDKIFERHVTYRPNEQRLPDNLTHFGVGLALVRRNIELLGGRVTAHNLPRAGLRIAIDLQSA